MNKHELGKQIAITMICIILGFAISLQIKSVTINYAINRNSDKVRTEELQLSLNNEKEKNEQLYSQILQLKGELDTYRGAAEASDSVSEAMKDQLYNAELLAGMVTIKGPGVLVTMKDANKGIGDSPAGAATNDVIHDSDIRSVINELLASGAEAVALNDERIVSTSAIRCVGPTVIVNNTRYSTPFVISAIGEPKTLEAGMNIKGGVADLLRAYGITVDIKTADPITIPAYKGAISFKYVLPAEKRGE